MAAGVAEAEDGSAELERTDLKEAVTEYFAEVKAHNLRKTDAAYSIALNLLLETCPKKHLEEIDRTDMLAYMAHLKTLGNAPGTVANRVANVKRFFNLLGVEWSLRREDKPKYTTKAVAAYSAQEVRQLRGAADTEEAELLQFFLFPGGREQEIHYATWANVDFQAKTFTVREKLDMRFTRPRIRKQARSRFSFHYRNCSASGCGYIQSSD